jgi:hypothetical protein
MNRRPVSAEVRSVLTAIEEDFPVVQANTTPATDSGTQTAPADSVDTKAPQPSQTVVDSVDTKPPATKTPEQAKSAGECKDDEFDKELSDVEAMIARTETAGCEEDEDEDDGEEDGDDLTAMINTLEAALDPQPVAAAPDRTARVAGITSRLDKMADALQALGRKDLAERVDVVSNYLEAHAAEIE